VLLCQGCIGEHANARHTVSTVDVVGKEQASAISAALPELRQGVAHQVAQAAQARSLLETLALNRSVALEALAAATARLHADVDARHTVMVREIDAAYNAKVAGLQRELSAARAGAAELATMVATAEAALAACTASVTDSVMCVHVGRSVEASLEVARCRNAVDSDWCRLTFEAAGVEEGADGVVSLGRLRTFSTAPAAVSELCGTLCLWHLGTTCCRGRCACARVYRRLRERSCCGVLLRSSKGCSMLACVQRHESYSCTVCYVFRTHSLSRCCLYQATRDVDVAVKAPAVTVVSE
jgi:hypothetical protein